MTAQASDRVLERLGRLHPKLIDLSLGRVERLLATLGSPQDKLPPIVHVAGTNGKGSTIATLRACLEAGGYRVHAYTSPHLVRFHERIRLAGQLIEEGALIALLEECECANDGAPITYFEITTAAAFVAFVRTPADILLLETGLGGRLDATNVIRRPAVTAITPISLDRLRPKRSSRRARVGSARRFCVGSASGAARPPITACVFRATIGGSNCHRRRSSAGTKSPTRVWPLHASNSCRLSPFPPTRSPRGCGTSSGRPGCSV